MKDQDCKAALEAVDVLVSRDLAFELEMWLAGKREASVWLLEQAAEVVGKIYCITHSELHYCAGKHDNWRQIKHKVLQADKVDEHNITLGGDTQGAEGRL